jgi:hypothetical protein
LDLFIIQGPFSVAPCQSLISRFATFSHRCKVAPLERQRREGAAVAQLLRTHGERLSARVLRGCQRRSLCWPLLAWRGAAAVAAERSSKAAAVGGRLLCAAALSGWKQRLAEQRQERQRSRQEVLLKPHCEYSSLRCVGRVLRDEHEAGGRLTPWVRGWPGDGGGGDGPREGARSQGGAVPGVGVGVHDPRRQRRGRGRGGTLAAPAPHAARRRSAPAGTLATAPRVRSNGLGLGLGSGLGGLGLGLGLS